MWNFIRVEYKHIEICKEFKVSLDVELPFKKNEKGEFVLKNAPLVDLQKINKRVNKMRSKKYMGVVLRGSNEEKSIALQLVKSTSRYNLPGRSSQNNNLKDYESGEFRNKFTPFLDQCKVQLQNYANKGLCKKEVIVPK